MANDQASLLLRKQLKGKLRPFFFVFLSLPSSCAAEVCLPFSSCMVVSLLLSAELSKRPVEGFSAGLVDDTNLFQWAITVMGPPDTL